MQTTHHYARWAVIFALLALLFAWIGNRIERDFGRLDVSTVTFMTEELKPMVGKLYRPKTATAAQPAPALLALHGYQSERDNAVVHYIWVFRRHEIPKKEKKCP